LQPSFGEVPIAFHGAQREIQHASDFRRVEAAEEAQFDDSGVQRVTCREFVESAIDVEYVRIQGRRTQHPRRGPATISLGRLSFARVIDQNPAHHLRRYGDEMAPPVPINVLDAGDAQVKFMHEGCGLERVAGAFVPQIPRCQTAEIPVYQTGQLLYGAFATILPTL